MFTSNHKSYIDSGTKPFSEQNEREPIFKTEAKPLDRKPLFLENYRRELLRCRLWCDIAIANYLKIS